MARRKKAAKKKEYAAYTYGGKYMEEYGPVKKKKYPKRKYPKSVDELRYMIAQMDEGDTTASGNV